LILSAAFGFDFEERTGKMLSASYLSFSTISEIEKTLLAQ
jgi:hypothetical protein